MWITVVVLVWAISVWILKLVVLPLSLLCDGWLCLIVSLYKGLLISARENIDVLFRKNALLKCLCIISNICLRSLDSLIIDLFWGVGNYKKLILVRLYFDSGLTHISHYLLSIIILFWVQEEITRLLVTHNLAVTVWETWKINKSIWFNLQRKDHK